MAVSPNSGSEPTRDGIPLRDFQELEAAFQNVVAEFSSETPEQSLPESDATEEPAPEVVQLPYRLRSLIGLPTDIVLGVGGAAATLYGIAEHWVTAQYAPHEQGNWLTTAGIAALGGLMLKRKLTKHSDRKPRLSDPS